METFTGADFCIILWWTVASTFVIGWVAGIPEKRRLAKVEERRLQGIKQLEAREAREEREYDRESSGRIKRRPR